MKVFFTAVSPMFRTGRSCYQEAEEERRGRPKEVEGHGQKQRPYLKWEKFEKEEEEEEEVLCLGICRFSKLFEQ